MFGARSFAEETEGRGRTERLQLAPSETALTQLLFDWSGGVFLHLSQNFGAPGLSQLTCLRSDAGWPASSGFLKFRPPFFLAFRASGFHVARNCRIKWQARD